MASTYGAGLRARLNLQHSKAFGQVGMAFPESFYEEVFQQKLTGGYKTDKKNLCEDCFTFKSSNGHCNCP